MTVGNDPQVNESADEAAKHGRIATMESRKYRRLGDAGRLAVLAGSITAIWLVSSISAGPPADATYLGVKKCKSCHFKEYKGWKKMKHAKAWDNLPEADRKKAKCVGCHVTGIGRPGGFVDEEKTPKLTGVQCESCHGPGSAHAKAADDDKEEAEIKKAINKVPQNTCIKCHNPHKKHTDYEE